MKIEYASLSQQHEYSSMLSPVLNAIVRCDNVVNGTKSHCLTYQTKPYGSPSGFIDAGTVN